MNRIQEHQIMAVVFAVMLVIVAGLTHAFCTPVNAATDIPRHALYLMEMTPDKFVHPQPDPEGQWVLYENVQPAIDAAVAEATANCGGATTAWYPIPLVPEQDERQLLCEVRTGVYAFRDYIDGQWRVGASTGPAPLAWARINARTTE